MIYNEGVVVQQTGENVSYEALSFCWGEPTYTRLLRCSEVDHPITGNLFAALKRLRVPHCARYLCVYALCINQDDLPEKSVEVRGMLAVYNKTNQVMIWLGEEGSADTALYFLNTANVGTVLRADRLPRLSRIYADIKTCLNGHGFAGPGFGKKSLLPGLWRCIAMTLACHGNDFGSPRHLYAIEDQLKAGSVEFRPLKSDIHLAIQNLRQATPAELGCVSPSKSSHRKNSIVSGQIFVTDGHSACHAGITRIRS